MKISCRFSGVTFTMPDFGSTYLADGEHPLMSERTTAGQLLDMYHGVTDGTYNVMERRLLFVALMKKSELYRFYTSASPAPDVVEMNIEPLVRLVMLLDAVHAPTFGKSIEIKRLPGFAITQYNRNCRDIHMHLAECHAKLDDWRQNWKDENKRQRLESVEAQLMKALKSPYDDPKKKIRLLARWMLRASEAPKDLWEYWEELFCTPLEGTEVFKLPTASLEALYVHIHENLARQFSYESPIFAKETIAHINRLHYLHTKGLKGYLDIDEDEEFDLTLLDKGSTNPGYLIIDDESISERNARIIIDPPMEKPQISDFPIKMEYLLAIARWLTANANRAKQIAKLQAIRKAEAWEKEQLDKAALESSKLEEELELPEDDIDPEIKGAAAKRNSEDKSEEI